MNRLESWFNNTDKRGLICCAITFLSVLAGIFFMRTSLMLAWEGVKELALSVAFYFTEVFGWHVISPTIIIPPDVRGTGIPETVTLFVERLEAWGKLLIDKDNLSAFFGGLAASLEDIILVLVIMLPLIVLVIIAHRRALRRVNNDYGVDSTPLRLFKKATNPLATFVNQNVRNFFDYVKENKIFIKFWVVIWLINFNIVTIIFELLAYFFYFTIALTLNGFYAQMQRLLLNIIVAFQSAPWWIWFVIFVVIFNRHREKAALARLRSFEEKNIKTVKGLGAVAILFKGTMGKGKTTLISDMNMTQVSIFRDDALGLLFKTEMMFPNFSWILFENEKKPLSGFFVLYFVYP